MKRKILKNVEWGILVCTILLVIIGLVALTSATRNSDYDELQRQIIWLVISIPVMIVIIFIDYDLIAKISPILYGVIIIALIAVFFTEPINGATSWFNIGSVSIQPAEFAKIICILMLAFVITKIQKNGRDEISRITRLLLVMLVFAVPTLLIIKQPDYGTAFAFVMAFIFMLFAAGIKKRYIIISILLVVILVPVIYMFVLPDHAKTRIDVFLNPDLDPRGAGYNIIQSKIAIGSGGLLGMGLFKGNQTQLGFLYPKTTDFIFSLIAEEMGFIVAAGVIILYVILITKAIYVAKTAKDDLGSYIAMGIARSVFLPYARKYRNDNGAFTYNRYTSSICKLWWKFTFKQFCNDRNTIKYFRKKTKSNIYKLGEEMYLKKLKIGNVELRNNILLAPMAGITDLPFRLICEEYGAGLTCTEMVSSKGIFYDDSKTKLLLDMTDEKRPVAAQIFGSDLEAMKYASNYVSNIADIVDINFGCPAPKIVKNGDGSKLLLDLDLLEEIAKTVVDNSKVPVTAKIRKGWDHDHIVAVEAAKRLERAGVSAITVHGRTRAEYYSGKADWNIIKEVKESVNIPVIGNGDITSKEEALEMFKQTKVDGIMIGRASIGNPWIFEQVVDYLSGKEERKITNKEKLEVITKHINLEVEEKNEIVAVREMRKHLAYYIRGSKDASKIREKINRIESKNELIDCLNEYFNNI